MPADCHCGALELITSGKPPKAAVPIAAGAAAAYAAACFACAACPSAPPAPAPPWSSNRSSSEKLGSQSAGSLKESCDRLRLPIPELRWDPPDPVRGAPGFEPAPSPSCSISPSSPGTRPPSPFAFGPPSSTLPSANPKRGADPSACAPPPPPYDDDSA
jgi:hypothetical protein